MDPLSLCIILAGLFVGWNIGANDASNAIGTTVGGGIMTFRQAVIIVIVFAMLGSLLEGYKVMKTVGKGIVPPIACTANDQCLKAEYYCDLEEDPAHGVCRSSVNGQKIIYLEKDRRAVLAALMAAGTFVIAITALKLPTSTSQAIVGAVAGAGIGLNMFGGMTASINYQVLLKVFASWVLTPVGSLIIAYVLYYLFANTIAKVGNQAGSSELIKILTLLAAIFVSYNIGANDVANAVGPIVGANILSDVNVDWEWTSPQAGEVSLKMHFLPTLVGAFLGGITIGFGAVMFGRGVVETMGGGITTLGPLTALAAQFASAITVYIFTQQGIPVSTTQAIVGGVIGVGLTKGVRTVNLRTIRNIMLGWLATPTSAALLACGYYYLLRFVFTG